MGNHDGPKNYSKYFHRDSIPGPKLRCDSGLLSSICEEALAPVNIKED